MQCPSCHHPNSRVLESRSTEGGQSIRRRRECLGCHHRFTTYERIEFVPITVIKKDGKRESLDRSKLLKSIVRACEKTGIPHARLEALVDEIESQIQQYPQREITSRQLGAIVLHYLRQESEVAYVRFASVYEEFQGIKDFVETLAQIQQPTPASEPWDHSQTKPEVPDPISLITS